MATHKIEKQHWQGYFNELSKQFAGRHIAIESDHVSDDQVIKFIPALSLELTK